VISALDEQPVFFPGSGTELAGVLTLPPEPDGSIVLIPWGGGAYPSSGKNRIRTSLARAMAEQGHAVLRFDYAGVGESGGEYREAELTTAFVDDILAASSFGRTLGHDRMFIVANCFGGYSALMAARQLSDLSGLALIRAPVRRDHKQVLGAERTLREWAQGSKRLRPSYLLDGRRRAVYRKMLGAKARSYLPKTAGTASKFSLSVRHLCEHHVPILMLYSADDHFHGDLTAELSQGLGAVLDAAGPSTRLVLTDENLDGFTTVRSQAFVADEVIRWLRELTGPPSISGR
jgi:alpha/beta superfamily hydrolase